MPSSVGASGSLPAGYEFDRSLGIGGNAWVTLARQTDLGRLVAVKTVLTGVHDKAGQRRLERDGRAMVMLRHPHIVQVYALIPGADGAAALVMEYMPGGDLRTLIDADGLSGTEAVQVLTSVADGLQHAHTHGVVHRDIKPANILLGERRGAALGDVKITDFGLARLPRAAGAFRTRSGLSLGTAGYMAPEQVAEPDLEAPPIDVYSFSVLAYEVLAGAMPHPRHEPGAIFAAHLHDAPAPPWDVVPGFPVRVGNAILAGLSKDPDDRPVLAELAGIIQSVAAQEWDAVVPATPSGTRSAAVPSRTAPDAERAADAVVVMSEVVMSEVGEFPGSPRPAPRTMIVDPLDTSTASRPAQQISPPVYRPPKPPLLRRRGTYLSVALGIGAALGVALIILTGLR